MIDHNIKYERQKKFDGCFNKVRLSFDFWIENFNLLIEFDGIQHFEPVDFMGGLLKFEYTKKCDDIKNKYCISNNIRLLRISYKEINKMDTILGENLN